ncbi:MAG TPA: hypothetical protein DCR97_11185 [Deltaproteobacteria bacterium]|nr:hypothetical protein [Deltaproteobacteria bacterium]
MKTKVILTLTCMIVILFATPLWAADAPATAEGQAEGSLTELNKQLTNPISSLWSLSFQQNNFMLDMGTGQPDHWNSNLIFQPVLPVALTKNWNLITRPVLTLFNSVSHPNSHKPGDIDRTTAFGDTVLLELLSPSPKFVGNWLLGLGPTFIFPTASSKYTGQDKWQVGPAALVGYLSEKWILGALVQNWQSFAGTGDRDTNQMNLQPIAAYFLPNGWSIGYSGNILANWKADKAGDTWTVPLGVGISKVVKVGPLPVRLQLAGQYMVHHPDIGGQKWNIQLTVAPVIPKLIKGSLIK